MPTTSNFGWTTPADTDLVKDGAAAIRTLGNGIDTSLVDLKGGTTGQILSKNSNTDLDYTWINNDQGDITEVQAGTGISVASGTGPIPVVTNSMATEITAKGDLIVGTGSGTFDNLPVGTNGHTLVADSSTSTGLAWAAPAGGSLVGVSLYDTNVTQSINNNTYTALTWNSEDFDTDGFHSTTTNTSRITIPTGKGGKYRVEASTAWATDATGERVLVIRKNGSNVALNQTIGTTATAISNELSCVLVLAANDYIEAFVLQSSGGSLNAYKNDPDRYGWFSATYLGA